MKKLGAVLSIVLFIPATFVAAAQKVERQPRTKAETRATSAPASAEASRLIVPVFERESYRRFNDSSFRVSHRSPSEEAPYLWVELTAPSHDGFGGSCVERNGVPVDVSRYRSVDVDLDLETSDPANELQIKLERRKSTEEGAQFRLQDGPLAHSGRQTLTYSLTGSNSVSRALQRICFAMEASGFRGPSPRMAFKVFGVRFR